MRIDLANAKISALQEQRQSYVDEYSTSTGTVHNDTYVLKLQAILKLKGAQAWDIRDRFFTQIRGLWLGDLGTGKKNEISKVEVIILRFSP